MSRLDAAEEALVRTNARTSLGQAVVALDAADRDDAANGIGRAKYTYKTIVVGRSRTGMHYTSNLEEAQRLSSDGVIWRKPEGEWQVAL